VLLLDRHPYTTFQPLLYQVATGGLNAGDITYALRSFAGRSPVASAMFAFGARASPAWTRRTGACGSTTVWRSTTTT
jgi:hypothetical protein